MRLDFFSTNCKDKKVLNCDEFGLCDDPSANKAYADTEDKTKWVAIVQNSNCKNVEFFAIDNCVNALKNNGQKESLCDGMLIFDNNIYLVELKEQRRNWMQKAISQLENTIRLMKENHDINARQRKKAFACCKKHPNFPYSQKSFMKKFHDETGFRLDIQRQITIR